jgi:serine O-acetyltransferase
MGFWYDVKKDYEAVVANDPAVRNSLEVILAYPGFHAIVLHRIIHFLWNLEE